MNSLVNNLQVATAVIEELFTPGNLSESTYLEFMAYMDLYQV